MATFEVLAGLPPYGPMAKPFPASGRGSFRQGVVVRFQSETLGAWIGNFQVGFTSCFGVHAHPNRNHVLVVAGGTVYSVEPDTQTAEISDDGVYSVMAVPEKDALLFEDGISLNLMSCGTNWRTKRLSWDGIRNLCVAGDFVRGEGWHFDESWHEFVVSLATGSHTGGAYE
jgi:hypothetical protein